MRAINGKTPKITSIQTEWARLYMSGPIEVAKQIVREECLREGLCVTIEPTTFIYTGGEEAGYVVGLINYPKLPFEDGVLLRRARDLLYMLIEMTYQHSGLLMTAEITEHITIRD